MDKVSKRKVCRHENGSVEEIEDCLALETKVRVSVNGREVVSLYCTPHMVRELVVGLIATEGIIKGAWCAERMSMEYGDEIDVNIPAEGTVSTKGRTVTSGCVGGVTFDSGMDGEVLRDTFAIDRGRLKGIYREFQTRSDLYQLTGCIHSAALSDGRAIVCFAEDIGRHNAVDKVIGFAILENIPFSDKVMLASGRISSEISSKCARWGIPVLVSRTAPTDRAVEIAERRGITIVGFMRGNRFTVYSHPERVL
jgi:FdhD protein